VFFVAFAAIAVIVSVSWSKRFFSPLLKQNHREPPRGIKEQRIRDSISFFGNKERTARETGVSFANVMLLLLLQCSCSLFLMLFPLSFLSFLLRPGTAFSDQQSSVLLFSTYPLLFLNNISTNASRNCSVLTQ